MLASSDLPILIGGNVAGSGRTGAAAVQRNSGGFALGAEPAEVETALFVFRNRQAGAQHLMLEGAGERGIVSVRVSGVKKKGPFQACWRGWGMLGNV